MKEAFLLLAAIRVLSNFLPEGAPTTVPPPNFNSCFFLVTADFFPKYVSAVRRRNYVTSAAYKQAVRDTKDEIRYMNQFSHLNDTVRSIEVLWSGRGLFAVSFSKPRQCSFLTKALRDEIIESIDYTDDDRVEFFLSKVRQTSTEINLTMKYWDLHLNYFLLFQDELSNGIFANGMLINFVMLVGLQKGYFTGDLTPQYANPEIRQVMVALVICQLCLCVYKLFQTSLIRIPLVIDGETPFPLSPPLYASYDCLCRVSLS
jgi:hypothetical protein